MSIPEFTEHGVLPSGLHDCTISEAESKFCNNDHRKNLWSDLLNFLDWLTKQGIKTDILIDGSFVTDKTLPSDIDVIADITLAPENVIKEALVLFSFKREEIKQNYGVDFWLYHPKTPNDLRSFFQYIKEDDAQRRGCSPETRKGLLSISL